jgi:hypothetical protein
MSDHPPLNRGLTGGVNYSVGGGLWSHIKGGRQYELQIKAAKDGVQRV